MKNINENLLPYCMVIGGVFGAAFHVGGGILIESFMIDTNDPTTFTPYGQFAGVVILPIAIIVGIGFGLVSFGLCTQTKWMWSLVVAILLGLGSIVAVVYFWKTEGGRGLDNSAVVLFPLPTTTASILVVVAIAAMIVKRISGIKETKKKGKHKT